MVELGCYVIRGARFIVASQNLKNRSNLLDTIVYIRLFLGGKAVFWPEDRQLSAAFLFPPEDIYFFHCQFLVINRIRKPGISSVSGFVSEPFLMNSAHRRVHCHHVPLSASSLCVHLFVLINSYRAKGVKRVGRLFVLYYSFSAGFILFYIGP
jgi:hypothetical protein